MHVKPEGLHEQIENYEHLGDVKVCVMNLAERYTELVNERRYTIDPQWAHYIAQGDLPTTPSVVWDWINDPIKRALLGSGDGLKYVPVALTGGRTGANSITHCVHGEDVSMVETVRDWRPFDYLTVTQEFMGLKLDWQYVLTPSTGQSTHLEMRLILRGRFPNFINRLICKLFFGRFYPLKKLIAKMKLLIEDSNARSADRSQAETSEVSATSGV